MSACLLRFALVALGLISACAACRADEIVADLSSHVIGITTGFTGTSVVLFGATDGPGDVVAVVRGPEREMTVWRKGKFAGIWANAESMTFSKVPSFYALAATRPLGDILPPATATLHQIGLGYLRYIPERQAREDRVPIFTEALVREQQRVGLFPTRIDKVSFLGERLFRATLSFPATVPTGNYLVEIFLVRNQDVVSAQTTPLIVSQVGLDAVVFEFAQQQSLAYGAIAVLVAMMAGWLASLPFRGV